MLEINFNPFPTFQTKRLLLRRMITPDVPRLLQLRSRDETMQFIDKEKAKSLEDAAGFLQKVDDGLDKAEGITWGIALRQDSGLLIGYVGFWRLIKEHFRAETGYMLLPEYWKKGIMKEALTKLIPFAFNDMKLHSLEARINPINTASSSLLLSTGFVKEAYFKEDYFFNGKFGDTEVYSRLQDDMKD